MRVQSQDEAKKAAQKLVDAEHKKVRGAPVRQLTYEQQREARWDNCTQCRKAIECGCHQPRPGVLTLPLCKKCYDMQLADYAQKGTKSVAPCSTPMCSGGQQTWWKIEDSLITCCCGVTRCPHCNAGVKVYNDRLDVKDNINDPIYVCRNVRCEELAKAKMGPIYYVTEGTLPVACYNRQRPYRCTTVHHFPKPAKDSDTFVKFFLQTAEAADLVNSQVV